MNLFMRRTYVAFALILILPTFAVSQTVGEKPAITTNTKDEEGIRKVLADFEEAWNRHDAKAFSMVFSEDADFTNVRGQGSTGRSAVEKFHATPFATFFKDTHQEIMETKIRFIKPDVAVVDARWEMTGAKSPEGQDRPLRKGLMNFVMTRENGTWFITVMHNMDLPASP
ncbi:MAG: SgcJ/EcaC family oxidoreductase [Opitutaceae bacterium]